MNSNPLHVYEAEIQSLEEEVKMLTEEYELLQHTSMAYTDGELMEAVKSCKRKFQEEPKQYESPSDLLTQLDLLESDLSFIMKLTGIWLTNYSKTSVEKNGMKTISKYKLSGNCQSLPFQLEFQLEENQNNKNVSAVVSDLNVIMECEECSDLSKLVSRVEESGNLLQFFKSLSFFSEWCKHRKCTWAHFKSKYPDVIVLPEGLSGDSMVIQSTKHSGFEFMIVWKIHIDEDGKVTPVLDLLSKIPVSVLTYHNHFLSDAPRCFRSLLQVLGIEAALEALIKSLGTGK